ncbi:DUF2062 domain-containing protein [Rhodosalinus sp. FB01]|uniref:DUF2062 domain-containing protein n=1 Tax=Rhodosalinus sp. FB01 TaxID=3239194 RepID=UPI0035242BC1
MVFKRRDRRNWWTVMATALWPKGGWGRAFRYVKYRMRRLPGTPESIGRGIWAGVFVTFTPFYGLHFFIAMAMAWMMRGNVIASLFGTFFGNPLTYVPIGVISLKTGHLIMGTTFDEKDGRSLLDKFMGAGGDLRDNLWAWLTGAPQDWRGLAVFYDDVFLPYTIGGIIPGIIAATAMYFLSVPVIRAYQKRRAAKVMERLEKKLHRASSAGADERSGTK